MSKEKGSRKITKENETPESIALRRIRLVEKLEEEMKNINEAAIFEESVLEQAVKKMVEEGQTAPRTSLSNSRLAAIKEALEYVLKQKSLNEEEPEQEKIDHTEQETDNSQLLGKNSHFDSAEHDHSE